MKKRILAAALAAALAFLAAVSSVAAGVTTLSGTGGSRSKVYLSEFSTMLNVSYADTAGQTGQYYKSYAFAEDGKEAISWKEIRPADLTIGLEWDVSRLIKKPGRLILSSSAADGNTARTVSDCLSDASGGDVGYAVYTVTGIAPNPPAISGNQIVYSDTDAYVNIGAGIEWSKDGYTWKPADSDGPSGKDTADKWCKITLAAARQTVHIRGQAAAADAGNITLPSLKSIKVTIPAMPKAPKVRIYASQALLSAKAGLEISNDGKTWAVMTENTLALGAVTKLRSSGGGDVSIDLADKKDVYVRVPAGNGKPHSDVFETHIRISNTGVVSADDFTAAPKQTILVDNAVVIEAVIGGKWKKVRKLTVEDIPATGLKVRRAGTKDRLPGPERILKLVSDGGQKTITITE